MSKLICLLNHSLTIDQIVDAYHNLKVSSIIYPPENIKKMWSNVPIEEEQLSVYLNPIFKWIKEISSFGDFILVQGDFGATYLIVRFSMQHCLIPIYSKTKRIAHESILPSGEVKLKHIFLHQGFRIYGV